jgi:rhodanese-related sulfurtransferase/DNA-binding transcriptional ArsR family regulator
LRYIREIKEELNGQIARIGRALSSPKRLEILELLHQCEKSVEMLANNTGMSIANTSQHLQVLREAGLVESRREGLKIIYRLAAEDVSDIVNHMRQLARVHLAEVDQILNKMNRETGDVFEVDRETLLKLAQNGKVLILDVRPEDEYKAGHLPHALSVPLDVLESRIETLPRNQKIVAYCRGAYCILSGEAVRILKNGGFKAVKWQDGVAEWKAAGLPVEYEPAL